MGVADHRMDQDLVVQHVTDVLRVGVLAIEWEGGAQKHLHLVVSKVNMEILSGVAETHGDREGNKIN